MRHLPQRSNNLLGPLSRGVIAEDLGHVVESAAVAALSAAAPLLNSRPTPALIVPALCTPLTAGKTSQTSRCSRRDGCTSAEDSTTVFQSEMACNQPTMLTLNRGSGPPWLFCHPFAMFTPP